MSNNIKYNVFSSNIFGSGGGSGSGSKHNLSKAGKDVLGGIKIGDEFDILDDGTLLLSSDIFATDEDVLKIVNKVFGK